MKLTWPVSGVLSLCLLAVGTPSPSLGVSPKKQQRQENRVAPYVAGYLHSPDKKYSVREVHAEGDTTTITIVNVRTGKALMTATDVDRYRWVPGSPHRLVVAASGLYGRAMLALWEGGTHWRELVRVRDPGNEAFSLERVSRDGRFITYGHSRNVGGDRVGIDSRYHRHRLRLPPPDRH